jgi:hypothetical protein
MFGMVGYRRMVGVGALRLNKLVLLGRLLVCVAGFGFVYQTADMQLQPNGLCVAAPVNASRQKRMPVRLKLSPTTSAHHYITRSCPSPGHCLSADADAAACC